MRALVGQWLAEMRRTVRDRRFFIFTLAMPIGFYFIYSNMGGQAHLKIAGTVWDAYYMVSMAAFGVVGSAVNTLAVRLAAERQNGWVKLLRTTPLSTTKYAIAKILTQLTLSGAIIIAVFVTGHFSQGVSLPWREWFGAGLWLWLASIPFATLGVLIGTTGSAAQVLGSLTYLALSMLGGLWTPLIALPKTMQEIAKWMPTYRLAHPAWEILAGKSVPATDAVILLAYAVLFTAAAVLVQRQLDARPS